MFTVFIKSIKQYFFSSLSTFVLIIVSTIASTIVFAEQFSIVIVPDTQHYSTTNDGIALDQTQWIVANQIAEDIIYVSQLGDLVDSPSGCHGGAVEWARADEAMEALDVANIPYGVLPGNHDADPTDPVSSNCMTTRIAYNNGYAGPPIATQGFGPNRYSGDAYYGPALEQYDALKNDNNFTLFSSPGGVDFISINLAYAAATSAEETAVIAWADALLKSYPHRKAMITSHYILGDATGSGNCGSSDIGTYGSAIVDMLQDNPNVFMVLSAHCRGEKWMTFSGADPERSCMSDVNLMMSNYQNYNIAPGQKNSGYMRIMRIDTVANTVAVETFSPLAGVPDGTPLSALGMDGNSVANFTFTHNFNQIISPSVMLLLDSSGSMAWDVEGVPGVPISEQRITFARQSSQAFLDLLQAALPNSVKVQFGIVRFPNSAGAGSSAEIMTDLVALNLESRNEAVNVTIPGIAPSGPTPMLAGIELAANALEKQLCKSIVLLSDGYHNSPNTVAVGDPEVSALLDQIDLSSANPVPVYAISFGKKETNDFALLQHLATSTGGEFYDATTAMFDPVVWNAATNLSATFKNIITDIFDEDIEAGVDPLDVIVSEGVKSFDMPVNEHDTKLTFYISWKTLEKNLLNITVFDSTGDAIKLSEKGVNIVYGESYSIFSVDYSAMHSKVGRIGVKPWHIEIQAGKFNKKRVEPIQYSVLLQSGLRLSAKVEAKAYEVGEKLVFNATLTEGRRPLIGQKNVEVVVSTPIEGRGNWLSKNNVNNSQLDNIPRIKMGEFRSELVRKEIFLARENQPRRRSRSNIHRIKLFDDGSHGDKKSNDGVYSNTFIETKVEGNYSFHFQAKGRTARGNYFHREKVLQESLLVHASVKQTEVVGSIDQILGSDNTVRTLLITVIPQDQYQNFLGPGHSGIISVESKGAEAVGEMVDLLDGRYSQRFEIIEPDKGLNVQVNIRINDETKMVTLSDIIKHQ